jgi:hypothetical protein
VGAKMAVIMGTSVARAMAMAVETGPAATTEPGALEAGSWVPVLLSRLPALLHHFTAQRAHFGAQHAHILA